MLWLANNAPASRDASEGALSSLSDVDTFNDKLLLLASPKAHTAYIIAIRRSQLSILSTPLNITDVAQDEA